MIITEEFRDAYCGVKLSKRMRSAKALGVDTKVRGWWDRIVGVDAPDDVIQKLKDKKLAYKQPNKKKAEPKVVYVYVNKPVIQEKPKKPLSEETKAFISIYVENAVDFDKTQIGDHIYRMIHTKNLDWDYIQERLMRLEHKDFCKTNYWKYISAYTIIKNASHCNRCPSETNLQTHHKTYKHKGRELFFMNQDLEVLCQYCHRQEHGI